MCNIYLNVKLIEIIMNIFKYIYFLNIIFEDYLKKLY